MLLFLRTYMFCTCFIHFICITAGGSCSSCPSKMAVLPQNAPLFPFLIVPMCFGGDAECFQAILLPLLFSAETGCYFAHTAGAHHWAELRQLREHADRHVHQQGLLPEPREQSSAGEHQPSCERHQSVRPVLERRSVPEETERRPGGGEMLKYSTIYWNMIQKQKGNSGYLNKTATLKKEINPGSTVRRKVTRTKSTPCCCWEPSARMDGKKNNVTTNCIWGFYYAVCLPVVSVVSVTVFGEGFTVGSFISDWNSEEREHGIAWMWRGRFDSQCCPVTHTVASVCVLPSSPIHDHTHPGNTKHALCVNVCLLCGITAEKMSTAQCWLSLAVGK